VLSRAIAAYTDANGGRKPEAAAELASYMEVPLDASTFASYFATWQKDPFNFGLRRTSSAMVFLPMGQPRPATK
jgi:hypothetical protein